MQPGSRRWASSLAGFYYGNARAREYADRPVQRRVRRKNLYLHPGIYEPEPHKAMTPTAENKDNDLKKGATEDESKNEKAMTSMAGQLGHRDEDPMIKSADSDFPEPGESPEHNGQFKGPNQKDEDTRYDPKCNL